MRNVAKVFMVLLFLTSAMPLASQENNCASAEERYEQYKDDPELGPAAKKELCGCYREQVRVALNNHECQLAGRYYEKYTNLSGKTDAELERKINECLNPLQGTLEIKGNKTLLQQSEVRIDGAWVADPTQPKALNFGNHTLTVKHPNYDKFEKSFSIENGNPTSVWVSFACHGYLRIEGDETLLRASKIYCNDVRMDNPPINTSARMECGSCTIRVVHNGRKSFEKKLTIELGKQTTMYVNKSDMPFVDVAKYGYLQFQDNEGLLSNSSCEVYIDDERCWSPKDTKRLKARAYLIRIEHPDYETQTGYVTIEENKTSTFTISMRTRSCDGYLKIDSDQNKKALQEASVFIDGKKISSFPIGKNYELSCGSHTIRIELMNYKSIEGEVVIEKGKTKVFEANFPAKGSLILKGNSSLLSEAKVTIDGKDARYAVKRPQDLDVGKHTVRVVLDCYKTFEQTVTIKGGETETLNVVLTPTCKEITFHAYTDTYSSCEIYLDGQYKGKKVWTEKLTFGSHKIESRREGYKNSKRTIYVDKDIDEHIWLESETFKNFITGNVAYGFAPQWSFGMSYGRLQWKHTYNYSGWFVSVMAKPNSVSKAGDCDAEGFLADGSFPGYNGTQKRSRFSITAGLMFPLFEDYSHIRIGAGYGSRSLYWESNDGLYYKNLGYSVNGFDGSVGLQFRFNRIVVSADYVVTDFKFKQFSEIKIGVGSTF